MTVKVTTLEQKILSNPSDVSKETKKELPFGLITLYTLEWLYVYKTQLSSINNDLWRLQHIKVDCPQYNINYVNFITPNSEDLTQLFIIPLSDNQKARGIRRYLVGR